MNALVSALAVGTLLLAGGCANPTERMSVSAASGGASPTAAASAAAVSASGTALSVLPSRLSVGTSERAI